MSDKLRQAIDNDTIMPGAMQVSIVSGEGEIFSGRAKLLVASGEEGEIGIVPGHSQLLASLKPGEIRLVSEDGKESLYYVSGGFLEVQPDAVTVLADTMERAEDIDEAKAEEAKKRAEQKLASKQKLDNYQEILIELTKAVAQLRIARRGRKR